MESKKDFSRRKFISSTAMATIGTMGAIQLLNSCAENSSKRNEIKLPELLSQAPDGKILNDKEGTNLSTRKYEPGWEPKV